jgi:tRNA threonylcarbamoyladenosine biosynthesis protein TsaE
MQVRANATGKRQAMDIESGNATRQDVWSVVTDCAEQTVRLGRCLGKLMKAGDCLALCGPLGAGKTSLVTGLAEGMDVEGRVASPSFIVMRCHPGPVYLYHADAYRLQSPGELEEAGLCEWLEHGAVAIEWAELVEAVLPSDALWVRLEYEGDGRRIVLTPCTDRHRELLEELRKCDCWE